MILKSENYSDKMDMDHIIPSILPKLVYMHAKELSIYVPLIFSQYKLTTEDQAREDLDGYELKKFENIKKGSSRHYWEYVKEEEFEVKLYA